MPPLPPSLVKPQQQTAGHHHDHDHHHDEEEVSIRIDIDIDISVSLDMDLDTHVDGDKPHHREFNRSLPRPQNPVIISLKPKPTSGQPQSGDPHHSVTSKQKPLPHRTLKAIRQVAPPPTTPTRTVLTTHPTHHATLSASALIGIFLGSLSGLVLLLWGLSFLAARRRRRRLLSQQVKTSTSDAQPTTYYRGPDGDIFIHSLKSSGRPPLSPTLTSASDATLTAAAARLGRAGSRRCRSSHSHSRSRSRSHSRCRSRSRSHSRHRHGHCPGHGGHDHDHSHEHGHWHWHDHHGHHDHHCLTQDTTTTDPFEIPPVPEIPAIPKKSSTPSNTKEEDYTTVTVTEIPITLGPDSAPPPAVPRARVPSGTRIPQVHFHPSTQEAPEDVSPLQQNPFFQVKPDHHEQAIGTTALTSGDGSGPNVDKKE
ncbi:hypothetical protein V8F06_003355 [Rhypophila decipiens]